MSKTMDRIQRACERQWDSMAATPLVVLMTQEEFRELWHDMMTVSPHAIRPLPSERLNAVVNRITGELLPIGRLENGQGYAVMIPPYKDEWR